MDGIDDNSILKGLDDEDLDKGMPSDEDDEEDPELLADLERRQEELLEEFIEIAMQSQEEILNEIKVACKGKKMKAKETSEHVKKANE